MVPSVGGGVCRLDDTKRVNVPTLGGGYRAIRSPSLSNFDVGVSGELNGLTGALGDL